MPGERLRILKSIEEGRNLPVLSPVAVRLMEMASEESTSVQEISRVIQQDPSLSTRLLKLVNSAAFGVRHPIHTPSHAVVHLGLKRVRIMALSLSLRETFKFEADDPFDYDRFWRLSLFRAAIARSLCVAARGREVDPEEGFVAGLILEIGQLMLYHALSHEQRARYPHTGRSLDQLLEWEKENLDLTHRHIGRTMLRRWRFPDDLVQTQETGRKDALSADAAPLSRITELASWGAEILFHKSEDLYAFQEIVHDTLGLSAAQVHDLLTTVVSQVEELAAALEIKAIATTDFLEVMEKANQALSRLNGDLEGKVRWFIEHRPIEPVEEGVCDERTQKEQARAIEAALQAVAHEIRNPLTALSGFARRLSKSAPETDTSNTYLNIIVSEAARLERILEDLNEYVQDYRPRLEEHDLSKVLPETLEPIRKKLLTRDIALSTHVEDSLPPLSFDLKRIREILLRFVALSARAIEGKGSLSVSCAQDSERGTVNIVISDTGKALPEEALDKLWDPIMLSKSFGHGLSIPVARKILAAHGGSIRIGQNEQGGNRTEICLPAGPPMQGSFHWSSE